MNAFTSSKKITTRIYSTTRFSLQVMLILAMVASMALAAWPQQNGSAATVITVNSSADSLANDGQCTLREAIISANKDKPSGSKSNECPAGSGSDTIVLPAGVFTLKRTDNGKEDSSSTGDLDITSDLTITGAGAANTIINATAFTDRIVEVISGSTTISGLTLTSGNVKENGGGIYNHSSLQLVDVAISNNLAGVSGGGIYNGSVATLVIQRSTINGNQASFDGGGIYNQGTLSVTNSTLSGNRSANSGGGLLDAGSTFLKNTTVAFNQADSDANGSGDGGGISAKGNLQFSNTLVGANNDASPSAAAPDCSGSLISQGYNLVQNVNSCTISGDATGLITGKDPLLAPLADNGGQTPTHELKNGSPAIDRGNPSIPGSSALSCEAKDQRGFLRPRGQACDIGAFEAGQANSPVLIRAFTVTNGTTVEGRLFSAPNTAYSITLYASETCEAGSDKTAIGTLQINTGENGNVYFQETLNASLPLGTFITAVASDSSGSLSGSSACVRLGLGNDSWPRAFEIPSEGQTVLGYLDLEGQSRWYKFAVKSNSRVNVTLTNLPANYDLTLYKNIPDALKALTEPQDLIELGAEFAPDAYSPDAYSPDAYSPDAYSPDAYSPDAYSPDAYSPDAYSPDAYSPDAYSPDAYSPDAYSPDAYSPDAYSPDAYSPDAYSPDAYSPANFLPDAYSGAQLRSLIGVSAFNGTAGEGIRINTWDNDSYFYIRVRGRNGAFDPNQAFSLKVKMDTGLCSTIAPISASIQPTLFGEAGSYQTLILTDWVRIPGSGSEKSDLQNLLNVFSAQVSGKQLDVSQDARVAAAIQQADGYPQCPYAKNLLAQEIKGVIDRYWEVNPELEYIVILGNDDVVPFFRHPDQAQLANEKNYVPPVLDNTASQASLRQGYILSQDAYGAQGQISFKNQTLPIPSLAVGRLVENAAEMSVMLQAYLNTSGGVVDTPTSSLVTGYDFLEDAALAVQAELEAGVGSPSSTLISPRTASPAEGWNADQLRSVLLDQRSDLIFLAGHFSASSALAADYQTRLTAEEVWKSAVDLENSIIFSAGCHAGYNIVDPHGIPLVTREPDWSQAFARKGATLIAGTGYQYGDTDFIKYSEQLYLYFSQQLRYGNGPVAVGKALAAAKQQYLANTPQLRGIDHKAVLEATLFGLPMLSVDLPAGRIQAPEKASIVPQPVTTFPTNPGSSLGLQWADIRVNPVTNLVSKTLEAPLSTDTVTAAYLNGPDGVVSRPTEPVLPQAIYNVSVPGTVLRGVGFIGGDYEDLNDIWPLTGAATTEVRGVHALFFSNIFYPVQPWQINYFDALVKDGAGATYLNLHPGQYISASPVSPTGILRKFNQMDFRLFFSSNIASSTSGGISSTPAQSAPPAISKVYAVPEAGKVTFYASVVGNPAAGIQEVWVTYTAASGPFYGKWQSLPLQQDGFDSSLWTGELPLGAQSAEEVRYIVQAANGVGLVSLATNLGAYYTPGQQDEPTEPTELQLVLPNAPAPYGTQATFQAQLTNNGVPLPNQVVSIAVGPQTRQAITDSNGWATASMALLGLPGENDVRAAFNGTRVYQVSSTTQTFTITRQSTQINFTPDCDDGPSLTPATAQYSDPANFTATLRDVTCRRLGEKTLFFIVSGTDGGFTSAEITDYAGRASLDKILLPAGDYSVDTYFSGLIPIPDYPLNLDDERYNPAFNSRGLAVAREDATVAYTGETLIIAGATLELSAQVSQADDGYPGDITLAVVQYDIIDADGQTVAATTSMVAADGSSSASLSGLAGGAYIIRTTVIGSYFSSTPTDTALNVYPPPDCSTAEPSVTEYLWPPNGDFIPVNILNVVDAGGAPVTITITGIWQDEPVGTDANSPDGMGVGTDTAWIRSERDGNGNGRVYHIYFDAVDALGGTCSGEIRVAVVPHDQSSIPPMDSIDDGPLYDSTGAN